VKVVEVEIGVQPQAPRAQVELYRGHWDPEELIFVLGGLVWRWEQVHLSLSKTLSDALILKRERNTYECYQWSHR